MVQSHPEPLAADPEIALLPAFETSPPAVPSLSIGQWAYVTVCLGLICVIGWLNGMQYGRQSDVDYLLTFAVMVALFPWREEHQHQVEPGPTSAVTSAVPPTSHPPRTSNKPRYYYLDNLKAFLTFIVVLHHITLAYSGGGQVTAFILGNQDTLTARIATGFLSVNQSYFMCLFFFVSGYFTPRSFERKGTREFVRDKLKRYGLPFLAFNFVLNPLTWLYVLEIMSLEYASDNLGDVPISYIPGEGPPWFLKVLIIFNLWYVVCPAPPLRLRMPALWLMCVAGAVLGLVETFCVAYDLNFLGTPLAQGSFPFDVVFFFAGCVAQRDEWLTELLHWPRLKVGILYALALVGLVGFFVEAAELGTFPMTPACPPLYHSSPTGATGATGAAGATGATDAAHAAHAAVDAAGDTAIAAAARRLQSDLPPPPPSADATLADDMWFYVCNGVFTVVFSLFMLHFWGSYLNATGRCCRFFNEAAYGVYVVHAAVWPLVSYAYVGMLRASGTRVGFYFCISNGMPYTWNFLSEAQLALGWGWTAVVSNLVLWPSMFLLRKLPGFNQVL